MNDIIKPIEFDDSIRKKSITFSVYGRPRGKERPRTVRLGGRITTYTPKQTVDYENQIRKSYKNTNGNFYLENTIEAEIKAEFPIPKSITKKEKAKLETGLYRYDKKPDCDNIAKIVLDALNGIAYKDDSQICKLSIEKIYSVDPKVTVTLKEIDRKVDN